MTEVNDFPLDWEEEDSSAAQTIFTDREEFKQVLIQAVEMPQSIKERRVKVFYGAGGQGKSALKNEFFLKTYLKHHPNEDIIYTDKVDFEDQEKTRLADEALLRIAEDLIEKGRVPLPAFCLGFLRYKMLTSAEKNIQQDYPFLYKIKFIGNDLANEICNTIVKSGIELIAGGSSLLLGVGFFTKKIADLGHKKIVEWIQKSDARRILGDIDDLNSLQLLERLPRLLAYDINKYLKNVTPPESPYPQKRIIIIFDGYETLWRDVVNPDVDRDGWIRTLVEQTPGVLFVFFGRDKLRWAEKNEAFSKILDQHLLKGLSDEDADGFLTLSGIEENQIRRQIILSSKNSKTPEDGSLPFYLDLQVKTYRKIIKAGRRPTSEDFNKNDEEVIKHFFEHLHPDVAGAIKALSLAPYIDEEIIELYVQHNYISPNTVSLRSLARHSFVRFDNNRAMIHGLMKEMAIKNYQLEFGLRFERLNRLLFDYFDQKLPTVQQEINGEIERYLEQASVHLELISKDEFVVWVSKKAAFYYGFDDYGVLTNLLLKALRYFYESKGKNLGRDDDDVCQEQMALSDIYMIAEIKYYLACRYNWCYNFLDAKKYISECIGLIESLHPVALITSIPKTDNRKGILFDLISLLHNASEFFTAVLLSLDLYLEAYKYFQKAQSLAYGFGLRFNRYAYGKYLVNVGRFAEAEPIFYKSYYDWKNKESELSETDIDLWEGLARTANDIARMLQMQKRHDEAVIFHLEAVEIIKKTRTADYPFYLVVKLNYVRTLVALGKNFNEAKEIYNEIFEILRKKYDSDHVHFGDYYLSLAKFYVKQIDFANALYYFNKGSLILIERIGPFSKVVIESHFEICLMIHMVHREGNIENQQLNSVMNEFLITIKFHFEKIRNLLGIYNPLLHDAIELAVSLLNREGDIETVLWLQQKHKEFIRVTNNRTSIRYHYYSEPVIPDDRHALITLFRTCMSLPSDQSQIELLEINLPFYNDFQLYKLNYRNTDLPVNRYLLSNRKEVSLLDYTNRPVYNVNLMEGRFTAENILAYISFFFDSVCGKHGFFYIIFDEADFPWCEDVEIDEVFKKRLLANLKPVTLLYQDDIKAVVSAYMIFKDSLFKANIEVYKEDLVDRERGKIIFEKGSCLLQNQMMCLFDTAGNIYYQKIITKHGDKDKIEIWNTKGELVDDINFNDLSSNVKACIDPQYSADQAENEKPSFEFRIFKSLEICRIYMGLAQTIVPFEEVDVYKKRYDSTLDYIARLKSEKEYNSGKLEDLINSVIAFLQRHIERTLQKPDGDRFKAFRFSNDINFLYQTVHELSVKRDNELKTG